jgi:hypothetical protein
MKVHMRKNIGYAALGVAVLASGCSGGSSSAPAVPAAGKTIVGKTTGTTAKAKLTIKVPIRKHVASAKVTPKYVSPSTSGLYIRAGVLGQISSDTPWQSFDVAPAGSDAPSPVTSQQCVPDPTNTFTTCTVTVTAPAVPGSTDEFQIIATDWGPTPAQTNVAPIGLIDSAADDTGPNNAGESITAAGPNAINVSLEGFIGRLFASDVSVWAAPGASTTFYGYLTTQDADSNPIFGNPPAFVNPISLSSSSPISDFPLPSTLTPPNPAGPIYAPMTYTAPMSTMAAVTTVNMTAIMPSWITAPTAPAGYNPQNLQPTGTFDVDPMTVNQLSQSVATPIGSIDLSQGDVTIMVSESEMTTLAVGGDSGLSLTPAVTNGSAQFTIPASDTSTVITITDDRKTQATLPVVSSTVNTTAIRKAKR